jgi:hypothetical protein
MTRRPSNIRERDIAKALKGARAAGMEIARVEIDLVGKIILFTKSDSDEALSPLEKWRQDHGAR